VIALTSNFIEEGATFTGDDIHVSLGEFGL